MSVSNISASKIEIQKREIIQGDIAEAILRIKQAANDGFKELDTQEKLCTFVQRHEKALMLMRGVDSIGMGEQVRIFEKRLIEVGLFGSLQNYQRIPAILSSALKENPVAPFSITRLISANNGSEQILIKFEVEETLLHKQVQDNFEPSTIWWVEKPILIEQSDGNFLKVSWQRLCLSPARFLRYSRMVTSHFAVENVARETLQEILPNTLVNMTLQYVGYPSESTKASAQTKADELRKELGATQLERYALPVPEAENASAAVQPTPGVLSRVKNAFKSLF